MPRRPDQLAHALRDLVGRFLTETIEFPAGTLVTVTRADFAAHGGRATVHLSVLPPERGPAVLALLRPHLYALQGRANTALGRRHVPRLRLALEPGPAPTPAP